METPEKEHPDQGSKIDLHHLESPPQDVDVAEEKAEAQVGTVHLFSKHHKDVNLVPAPSDDPQDPLNLPLWRKYLMLLIISTTAMVGNGVVGNAGSLFSYFFGDYLAAGKTVSDIVLLITIPTLTMALGNLLFLPIALAVGRRPVYIFATTCLVVGCILAANNTGFEYHLGSRVLIGFAAGQSEALVPLMIKETFFLHQRSSVLTFQSVFLVAVGNVLSIFSSQMAANIGWRNWYYTYAGMAGFCWLISIPLMPETKYNRPLEMIAGLSRNADGIGEPVHVTQSTRPAIDYVKYPKRTLMRDLRPVQATIDWGMALSVWKGLAQMTWLPPIVIIILLNMWTLTINIAQNISFATIVEAPPYSWPAENVGYATGGVIVAALLAGPYFGWANDFLIKWRARRNNGVHEAEARLGSLHFPGVIAIFSCVLYGAAATHPNSYHWFTIIWAQAANAFYFLGASVTGITYLLDCYPTRGFSCLVLVCAWRGLAAFSFTYFFTPATDNLGYLTAYGIYAAVYVFLFALVVLLNWKGKAMRVWSARFVKDDANAAIDG